jgi:hypothetical protein
MDTDSDDCSWQDTYKTMGCELPYEDDSEPDEIDDDNELTRTVDEIRVPLNPPRPAPESPYIPDYCAQEAVSDIYEPTFGLFGR